MRNRDLQPKVLNGRITWEDWDRQYTYIRTLIGENPTAAPQVLVQNFLDNFANLQWPEGVLRQEIIQLAGELLPPTRAGHIDWSRCPAQRDFVRARLRANGYQAANAVNSFFTQFPRLRWSRTLLTAEIEFMVREDYEIVNKGHRLWRDYPDQARFIYFELAWDEDARPSDVLQALRERFPSFPLSDEQIKSRIARERRNLYD